MYEEENPIEDIENLAEEEEQDEEKKGNMKKREVEEGKKKVVEEEAKKRSCPVYYDAISKVHKSEIFGHIKNNTVFIRGILVACLSLPSPLSLSPFLILSLSLRLSFSSKIC